MREAESGSAVESEAARPGPAVAGLPRRLVVLALGPAAWLLFRLGAAFPWAVEGLYASWPGPAAVRALSTVSGLAGFALVEPVVLGVLGWSGWALRRELRSASARGRGSGWALAGWILTLGETASVLTALFYVLWGFNYDRPPLEARLGWTEVREIGQDELDRLAVDAVQSTNAAYRTLHGADDTGAPTRMPADRSRVDHALVEGWASAAVELGLSPDLGRARGPVKTLLLGGLMSEMGLLGFYFPYTAEPVVNGRAPAVLLPRSMAHEQAHQRGIAPEDEANFMAIMSTIRSPDPLVRYSGFAAIQRRLLNDLAARDRSRALEIARDRLPGVVRDARDLDEFYRSLQGPVNRITEEVNDVYLRHHGVEGGILSYGLVTRLLVAYARSRGGALPEP